MVKRLKALVLRMSGMALAFGLAVLSMHVVLGPLWRKNLARLALSGSPHLAIPAERALLQMGEKGMDALFKEAQRCWELPDVQDLRRIRIVNHVGNLAGRLPGWLLWKDGRHAEVLTEQLRVVRFGEELHQRPWDGNGISPPLLLEQVDFARENEDFRTALRRHMSETGFVVFGRTEDYFAAGMWKAFWRAHCAWQRGLPCPEYRTWYSSLFRSLTEHDEAPRIGAGYGLFPEPEREGPTEPVVWAVRDQLSRAMCYNVIEDLVETPWAEILVRLEKVILLFPNTPAAVDSRRFKAGVESIIEEERALDLTNKIEQMDATERRRLVAYCLRECDRGGSNLKALRNYALREIAALEGRPPPSDVTDRASALPEMNWELVLPELRALRSDQRPTRSIQVVKQRVSMFDDEDWSGWARYYTTGQMAEKFALPLLAESWDTDSDGDGLPDRWERFYIGSLDEGGDGDHDGDGLTNSQEEGYGTAPDLEDTDGDGYPDKEELDVYADPTSAESRPGPALRTGQRFWVP